MRRYGHDYCDRCKGEANPSTMSMFNQDILCMDCKAVERKHPDYDKAHQADIDAVLAGVRNYAGIGLPEGYAEWARIQKRLEYLRGEIQAERISYEEIAELQSLAEHIDKDDVQLLEWAGVPEGS